MQETKRDQPSVPRIARTLGQHSRRRRRSLSFAVFLFGDVSGESGDVDAATTVRKCRCPSGAWAQNPEQPVRCPVTSLPRPELRSVYDHASVGCRSALARPFSTRMTLFFCRKLSNGCNAVLITSLSSFQQPINSPRAASG